MRQRAWFLALGTLALVLAGCGGGAAGRGAGPPGAAGAPCRAAALALGYGPQVSPQTEEHADWYTLTNHGPAACVLDGYPAVTLYRADGTRLRPGASAWVLVAKNACIGPGRWRAARIRIALPGQRHESVTGPVAAGHGGVAMLDHCRDPRDPGEAVAVSPVEPTRLATQPVQ